MEETYVLNEGYEDAPKEFIDDLTEIDPGISRLSLDKFHSKRKTTLQPKVGQYAVIFNPCVKSTYYVRQVQFVYPPNIRYIYPYGTNYGKSSECIKVNDAVDIAPIESIKFIADDFQTAAEWVDKQTEADLAYIRFQEEQSKVQINDITDIK